MGEEVLQQTGMLGKCLLEQKTGDDCKQPHPHGISLCPCSLPPSPDWRQWLSLSLHHALPSEREDPKHLGYTPKLLGSGPAWSPWPVVQRRPSMLGSCRPPGSYLPPAGLALLSCTLRGDIINSPVGTLH